MAGENHVDLAKEYRVHVNRVRAIIRRGGSKSPSFGPSNAQQRKKFGKRNRDMARRHKKGETYRAIGERYGVTVERVIQIVARENRTGGKRP